MSAKHTPGPWEINHAGSGRDGMLIYDEVYVYAPSCGVDDIAIAADIADPLTGEPSETNGRLISAAPDLLEALKAIQERLLACGSNISAQDAYDSLYQEVINKAIAKATGETP